LARDNGVVLGRRALGLRAGTHFWNNEADIERLLDLVAAHGKNPR
jgi:selenocysteine lyase/cysteine desulfurase